MNFTYCRQVYMAYKKEKSKRKLPKLLNTRAIIEVPGKKGSKIHNNNIPGSSRYCHINNTLALHHNKYSLQ